jgi:hypothetical protein
MNPENPMTANGRRPSRMKRKTLYIVATAVSMLAYAVLLTFVDTQPWMIWPALGAALLGAVFGCFWVASLDEAAQQAHYIAWFWGGNAGLLLSMLVFVAAALSPQVFEPILSVLGAGETFAVGIAAGVVPAVIGYAIWWAVLWLRRG